MSFEKKYLKYKNKYLKLKKMYGGDWNTHTKFTKPIDYSDYCIYLHCAPSLKMYNIIKEKVDTGDNVSIIIAIAGFTKGLFNGVTIEKINENFNSLPSNMRFSVVPVHNVTYSPEDIRKIQNEITVAYYGIFELGNKDNCHIYLSSLQRNDRPFSMSWSKKEDGTEELDTISVLPKDIAEKDSLSKFFKEHVANSYNVTSRSFLADVLSFSTSYTQGIWKKQPINFSINNHRQGNFLYLETQTGVPNTAQPQYQIDDTILGMSEKEQILLLKKMSSSNIFVIDESIKDIKNILMNSFTNFFIKEAENMTIIDTFKQKSMLSKIMIFGDPYLNDVDDVILTNALLELNLDRIIFFSNTDIYEKYNSFIKLHTPIKVLGFSV